MCVREKRGYTNLFALFALLLISLLIYFPFRSCFLYFFALWRHMPARLRDGRRRRGRHRANGWLLDFPISSGFASTVDVWERTWADADGRVDGPLLDLPLARTDGRGAGSMTDSQSRRCGVKWLCVSHAQPGAVHLKQLRIAASFPRPRLSPDEDFRKFVWK